MTIPEALAQLKRAKTYDEIKAASDQLALLLKAAKEKKR